MVTLTGMRLEQLADGEIVLRHERLAEPFPVSRAALERWLIRLVRQELIAPVRAEARSEKAAA